MHATSFPTNSAVTMSWDPRLVYQETTAIDTDNSIRGGFLQWGGSIGFSKNVADFNMAQLMPASGA